VRAEQPLEWRERPRLDELGELGVADYRGLARQDAEERLFVVGCTTMAPPLPSRQDDDAGVPRPAVANRARQGAEQALRALVHDSVAAATAR
jgi:hypothetical protein